MIEQNENLVKEEGGDNQPPNENAKNKVSLFFEKWGWAFAIGFAILAFLFLFAPILSYEEILYDVDGSTVYVTLVDYFTNGFSMNWTMYLTIALIFLSAGAMGLGKWKKEFFVAGSMLSLLSLVFICLAKSFLESGSEAGEWITSISMEWGLGVSIFCMAAASVFSLGASYKDDEFTIRDITEDGILIAAAFGLNFITIPIGATGGSINLQMLPLMLIALRRGPFQGFVSSGIVYGLLTCLTDGYGFATFPFDYLIGFGSCAAIGFFNPLIFGKDQTTYNLKGECFLLLGGILVTFIRFVGGNASSILIYETDFVGALVYNAPYIIPSGLMATAVIMAVYGPLVRINKLFPVRK